MTPAQIEKFTRGLRIEAAGRQARLRTAADLLRETRYVRVLTDGMDIFNCEVERLEKEIRDLLAAMAGDGEA